MMTPNEEHQEIKKLQILARLVKQMLELSGADMSDPNLVDTPNRVAKAYLNEWWSGYGKDISEVLTVFPNNNDHHDLVMVKEIPFYSMCSHHLAPFYGKAAIGYIPDKQVLGLSKTDRILNIFAKRMQLQERLTQQVADTLFSYLQPLGIMVVLYNVEHTCMTSRGVKAHGAITTTSAVRGVFETDAALRSEFLSLLR